MRIRSMEWGISMAIAGAFALLVAWAHLFLFNFNADPRMVLQPWLLNQGFVQYEHIADEHSPLLPQMLAWLLPLFDSDALLTARLVHAFLVSVTVFITTLWVVNRAGLFGGMATGIFFAAWSSHFGFWGMWHNLALSPVYVLLCFILIEWPNNRRPILKIVLLGLIGGIALLLKQQAVLLIAIIFLWLMYRIYVANELSLQYILLAITIYFLAIAVPIGVYVVYYLGQGGTIPALFYWTIWFNLTSGYSEMGRLPPTSAAINRILPAFLLLIPFVLTFRFSGALRYVDSSARALILLFFGASLVFLYPRYSVSHWVVALPFLALVSGITCAEVISQKSQTQFQTLLQRGMYLALILFWFFNALTIYMSVIQSGPKVMLKYSNLLDLAAELEARIPLDEEIVLLPDNEALGNLYYLLQKQPPRFWVMNYPWFMNEWVIGQWIQAVEEQNPRFLIFIEGMADLQGESPALVEYVWLNYEMLETIDWEGRSVHIMTRR